MTMPESTRTAAFFVSCPRNLEGMLVEEFHELGLPKPEMRRLGVAARLTQEQVYRLVYGSRLASRVLRPISGFPCRTPEELYERACALDWQRIISPDRTFMITSSVSDSNINHSKYAGLKLKDAVVDVMRDKTGRRSSVNRENPDVRLDLLVNANRATISLYYSDGVMHRRGYRKEAAPATLKENLAAAVLRFSGWKGQSPLYDLFCGSGTLLLEAAMQYTRTPAGYFRDKQGFETLLDFSPELWEQVKKERDAGIRPLPEGLLRGWDLDAKAVSAANTNFTRTPYFKSVHLSQSDYRAIAGPLPEGFIVSNPPYGERMGPKEESQKAWFYESLGRFIREKAPTSRSVFLLPEARWAETMGLPVGKKFSIDNGSIEIWVQAFEPPAKET